MQTIIARWQDWSGNGVEYFVLKEGANEIVSDAPVLGTQTTASSLRAKKVFCHAQWRVKKFEITEIGSDVTAEFAGDGVGNWVDRRGKVKPQLAGAIDIDISITPFTITPPIRRRNLQRGQSQQIFAAYVPFLPGIYITTDRQRYTRGEVERSYREGNPK